MASNTRILSMLLSTPPALRPEIARQVFAAGARSRPLAAQIHTTLKFTRQLHPRTYHTPRYFTSSAAQLHSVPPVAAPPTSSSSINTTLPPSAATATTSSSPPPPSRSRLSRFLLTTSLTLLFFAAGFAMSAAPATDAVNGMLNGPTDAETLELYEPPTPTAAAINAHIVAHPLAQRLRRDPSFTESRPHLKIPAGGRAHNLTAGTLVGDKLLGVPPLAFFELDAAASPLPRSYQLYHLGAHLCGHPGIVHGGLLATLLDEGLARACFPALPNKVAVTANLNVNYRAPVLADQYVVLVAETTKVDGRKAWARGWISVLGDDGEEGPKLVEAQALYIEPKAAKSMARLYGNSA